MLKLLSLCELGHGEVRSVQGGRGRKGLKKWPFSVPVAHRTNGKAYEDAFDNSHQDEHHC